MPLVVPTAKIKPAPRPYFEAKIRAGAVPSVAAATGTSQRTTFATGSVTLPQLAGVVMALLEDLKTRGVIS